MTPPDRWREAAREIRQTMKDADLVWSLISEGKLTGMLRRLFPAREEGLAQAEVLAKIPAFKPCSCGREDCTYDDYWAKRSSTGSERQKEEK